MARAQATSGVRTSSAIEQAVHEGLRLEGDEVIHPLPHAHESDGQLQAIQDGHDHAALGAAIQLGEDQVRDAGDPGEGLRLVQAVLARGGVQNQEHPVGRIRDHLLEAAVDLVELLHQVVRRGQPARGVDEHPGGALGEGAGGAVEGDGRGIAAHLVADHGHPGPLAPELQLVDGGGAEGVAGHHQHALAPGLQEGGQLAQGGGLADAVDAHQQHHLGALGDEGPGGPLPQDPQQLVLQDRLGVDLGATLELAAQPGHELLHGGHAQVGLEQQVLQLLQLGRVQPTQAQQATQGRQHQLLGALEPLLELAEETTQKTHAHLASPQSTEALRESAGGAANLGY